jgi:hypothetical protein
MQGALTFLPFLRKLLGDQVDSLPVSRPYVYAVHRDSLLSVEQVERHLQKTRGLIVESGATAKDYFGVDPAQSIADLTGSEDRFNHTKIVAAFQTPEVAVSAAALADLMRQRIACEPNVRCVMGATVTAATPCATSVDVEFELRGTRETERYDHAINALWDGRLKVDLTAGVRHEHPWLFRTKYNLRLGPGELSKAIPSVSFVLGAFGDIVQYEGGEAYLSWYKAGLTALSSDLTPAPFPAQLQGDAATEVRQPTIEALADLLPSLRELAPELERGEVNGGIIFAWGNTDITDPDSGLHRRHDIGPRSYGRYHSVDTGKFTTAPLFARRLADAILGSERELS